MQQSELCDVRTSGVKDSYIASIVCAARLAVYRLSSLVIQRTPKHFNRLDEARLYKNVSRIFLPGFFLFLNLLDMTKFWQLVVVVVAGEIAQRPMHNTLLSC